MFLRGGIYAKDIDSNKIGVICLFGFSGCAKQEENKQTSNEQSTRENVDETKKDNDKILKEEMTDLGDKFQGINGCVVFYNVQNNQYVFYNKDMCEQQVSPYSTFKIVSILMGLRKRVIENESSSMNYNGTQYPVSDWNDNLSLKEAFKTSCIWYFRQIIDSVGEDEVKKELNNLSYGNCDVSKWNGSNTNPIEELNGFWLESSLKISPLEQVQVLSKIFEEQSEYSSEDIEILKSIMMLNDTDLRVIYGKTGSGSDGRAWFVGFVEENGEKEYFAVYLNDKEKRKLFLGRKLNK